MTEELAAQEVKLAAVREQRAAERQKRMEEATSSADQTLKAEFPANPSLTKKHQLKNHDLCSPHCV